ncbi:MAG: AAA family ATPase [Proteobacteria bacterium]|nr:AAA family ATPase [Pseudomonadota bacterium]
MKISIPKEALNQITNDYNCTEEEAAKAYLDAQDRASEAFKAFLDERFDSCKKPKGMPVPKIYTPKEIKSYLDKYVVGQEEYKKRLAIAAAYHFAMIKHLRENPDDATVIRFRKKNTVTSGPSGSGKTYCLEVMGDLLQVPTLIVDATDYTEAGYVGKSADDMIRELIDLAPGYDREEQARFISKYGGMICIDEIDKKAKNGAVSGHDISREGFQRSVLKLIERKQVSINNPYSAASQIQEVMDRQRGVKTDKKESMISTDNILFILGGSFERSHDSLESIVKKRLQHKGRVHENGSIEIIGFSADDKKQPSGQLQNYYKKAEAEDFIKFGLLPELIGRSPIRTFVNLLSKNDLIRIMLQTEDSILHQYRLEFKLFNIDVEFTPEAVEKVAEISENRKTGARALVSVWENILTDFQFELPGSNFTRLEITPELCERPKDVLLEMLEKSPFVDFVENFRKEYGIELILDEDVQQYLEQHAQSTNIQVSEALRKLLAGLSALNYMGIKKPYKITREMLQDEKYFDKLFATWYENQQKNRIPADTSSVPGVIAENP